MLTSFPRSTDALKHSPAVTKQCLVSKALPKTWTAILIAISDFILPLLHSCKKYMYIDIRGHFLMFSFLVFIIQQGWGQISHPWLQSEDLCLSHWSCVCFIWFLPLSIDYVFFPDCAGINCYRVSWINLDFSFFLFPFPFFYSSKCFKALNVWKEPLSHKPWNLPGSLLTKREWSNNLRDGHCCVFIPADLLLWP